MTDAAGNVADEVVRTVKVTTEVVSDTEKPIITLTGEETVNLKVGETYTEAGATATDNVDTNLEVVIGGDTVNTDIAGTYEVTYNVTDAAGNVADEVKRTVNVTIASEFKIIPTFTPNVVMVFNILGIEMQVQDMAITKIIIEEPILGGMMEFNVVAGAAVIDPEDPFTVGKGTKMLKIVGKDNSGNVLEKLLVRTEDDFESYEVKEWKDKPVITLNGENEITLELGEDYLELGALAVDGEGVNITEDIVIDSSLLNINEIGTYEVKYNVTDSTGMMADEAIRIVIVADRIKPEIILIGGSTVNLIEGESYVDAGATATDNVDGDITGNIVIDSTVNTDVVGEYKVTYNVSDTSGNAAIEVIRTVNVTEKIVEDTEKPVITLQGTATINITVGESYVDAGATALDNIDGDITGNIVIDSTVNTDVAGEYKIKYNVTDVAGNEAIEVIRTVIVEEVKPITGSLTYRNEGLIPQTSNFTIELIPVNPEIETIYAQIKQGDTMWDTNMGTDGIIITHGTPFIYLIGTDAAGNILAETTMVVNWDGYND